MEILVSFEVMLLKGDSKFFFLGSVTRLGLVNLFKVNL